MNTKSLPKRTIILGFKDNIPIIEGYFRNDFLGAGIAFYCVACKKEHKHGAGGYENGGLAHRSSHCHGTNSSCWANDYYLRMVENC